MPFGKKTRWIETHFVWNWLKKKKCRKILIHLRRWAEQKKQRKEMLEIWRRAGGKEKERNDVLHPCWSHFIWPTPERKRQQEQRECLVTGSWEWSEKKVYPFSFFPFKCHKTVNIGMNFGSQKKSRWSRHSRRHPPPPMKERGVSSTGGLYTQHTVL